MRFKATRKWPIGQSDQVFLCCMKLLTRSHSGQAKQNKQSNNNKKQPMLLPISKCLALLKILLALLPLLQETHAFFSNLTTHAELLFPLQLPRRAR